MINPKCECGGTVKIKNHQRWIGYYCPDCKKGGSMQKDKSGNAIASTPKQHKPGKVFKRFGSKVKRHQLPTTPVSNCSCVPGQPYNNITCKVHGPVSVTKVKLTPELPLAPVVTFNSDIISYTKENLTFSMYISEMSQISTSGSVLTKGFNLKRPDTGTMMHFTATEIDKNDDEIEGWWYSGKTADGKVCRFLIIND